VIKTVNDRLFMWSSSLPAILQVGLLAAVKETEVRLAGVYGIASRNEIQAGQEGKKARQNLIEA
jgi:hypothetical protein